MPVVHLNKPDHQAALKTAEAILRKYAGLPDMQDEVNLARCYQFARTAIENLMEIINTLESENANLQAEIAELNDR